MSLLMYFHILAGIVGVLSGFAVLPLKKGSAIHRLLGKTFLISMLCLGFSGAIVAWIRDIPLSFLNGLLISYLVLTAYQVIKSANHQVTAKDWLLSGFGVGILLGYGYYIGLLISSGEAQLGGFDVGTYSFFALVTGGALLGDVRYLLVGGLAGKARLIRHLWRMLLPLFMATAAVFLGQAKLFPIALQQSGLLFVPVLTVLLALAYWLYRSRQMPQSLTKEFGQS
ncbi:hypothetical protein P2G88_18680 [Aliiglaciecola sp. CAU 1673]|uniref:hypothetical protein n=1 Tax=Aliiglaciecola sp. CAU 1673 TaxID=3032595 RepID=UPI0023DAFB74|nr:hypothetical protein [Aliiglaciecola sp. CAU 1673]MDF2180287.1 hypothetical protein [Aliiglaciecola sp. CAU 1673]